MSLPESEQQKAHLAWLEQQPETARCAFCPDWVFHGTVAECREQSLQHRRDNHPDRVRFKRRHRSQTCKVDGCLEPRAEGAAGVYAGLCTVHKQEAMDRRHAERLVRVEQEKAKARARKAAAAARAQARPKRQPGRERKVMLTPERIAECVRRNQAGELVYRIAKDHWQEWGFSSISTCWASIKWHIEKTGHTVVAQEGRPGEKSRITDARAEVIRQCVDARVPVSTVAELAYRTWGYASRSSCAISVYAFLKREGLKPPGWGAVKVTGDVRAMVRRLLEDAESVDVELEEAA